MYDSALDASCFLGLRLHRLSLLGHARTIFTTSMREDYLGDYKERVFRFDFVGPVEMEKVQKSRSKATQTKI